MLPAVIVCCFVMLCPESPRWYMSKNRHQKAYASMCKLRYNKVQAARDIFYMHTLLEIENQNIIKGMVSNSHKKSIPCFRSEQC